MKKPKLSEIINTKKLARRFVVRTLIKKRKPIARGAVQIAKKAGLAKQVFKIIGISLWGLFCCALFVLSIVLMTVFDEMWGGICCLLLSLYFTVSFFIVRRIVKKKKKVKVENQTVKPSHMLISSKKTQPLSTDEMIEFDELED